MLFRSLAVKECLHNVVKHSGASEARLSLRTNGQLEIVVQDNGRGIPTDSLEAQNNAHDTLTGNGLRNIRQRMEALGGAAIFENENGAKVTLRSPVAPV